MGFDINNFKNVNKEEIFKIIEAAGFKKEDFELNGSDETNYSSSLSKIERTVTVTRKSTKKEKIYQAGNNTNWLGSFDSDLREGFYN